MKDEIIELCHKIKNLDHCHNCGGNHSNGICTFCGKENQQLSYLIIQLEKEISKLPQNSFEQNKLDDCLTALYIIRNMNVPAANKILNEYNYEKTVTLTSDTIFECKDMIFGCKVSPNQETTNLLLELFRNNEFTQDKELIIANFIIKLCLDEKINLNISPRDKEQLILKTTELVATNVLGFQKVHTRIQDDYFKDKKETLGIQAKNIIYLSQQSIHGDLKSTFVTMFHELIHLKQYKEQQLDNILSPKNLIQIKDRILSNISRTYYEINYQNISFEKEAFFYEYRETIDYFNSIGVEVPDEFYQIAVASTAKYGDVIENCNRTTENGESININELFVQMITTHPEYIERFPQLYFEYKVVENIVIPKTLEEIKSDYESYQNGVLKWNGNQEEINNLYLNKIKELEKDKSVNK